MIRIPTGIPKINAASWQATGLVAWWPTAGLRANNSRRDCFGPYGTAVTTAGTTVLVSHPPMGHMLEYRSGSIATLDRVHAGRIVAGLARWTVAAWIYPHTVDNAGGWGRCIYSERGSGGTEICRVQISMGTGGNSRVQLDYRDSAGTLDRPVSSVALVANTLQHIAVTKNGTAIAFYINGVASGTATLTASDTLTTISYSEVGLDTPSAGNNPFDGYIGDLRLYNVALDAGKVAALYSPHTRWEIYGPPRKTWLFASAVASGTTTVRLTWTDNSEGEDGFSIERDEDGGGFVEIDTVAAGVETYDDTVDEGHTYTYRVRAMSAAKGDSEYSHEVEVTV